MSRGQLLAWEARWSAPAALAAFGAVLLVIAAIVVATQGVGGSGGSSELLRAVQDHRGAELISSILQAIGIALLVLPLGYLFRAAKGRSERMRRQRIGVVIMIGVVIAAPLFLAVAAVLSGVTTLHAASDFVTGEVPHLLAKGVKLNSDHADEVAKGAIDDAPLRVLAAAFGLAGQLCFLIAMVYTCLHAMRVGLLTRFWGSLGMALGVVSFLFFQFALFWFVYLGLLLLGRVPGGRPPAWASGEAHPWPTPGEKAAAALSPPTESDALPEAGEPEQSELGEPEKPAE